MDMRAIWIFIAASFYLQCCAEKEQRKLNFPLFFSLPFFFCLMENVHMQHYSGSLNFSWTPQATTPRMLLFVGIFWSLTCSLFFRCRLSQKPRKCVACKREWSEEFLSLHVGPCSVCLNCFVFFYKAESCKLSFQAFNFLFCWGRKKVAPWLWSNFMFCVFFHALKALNTQVNDKGRSFSFFFGVRFLC